MSVIGKKFHLLTVVACDNTTRKCECLCECGRTTTVYRTNIYRTKSCGCLLERKKSQFIGKRFDRLVVMAENGKRNKRVLWECRCDCGGLISTTADHLNSGHTRSCGCLQREQTSKAARRHGLAHQTPLYGIWISMRSRCNNPESQDFANYGGRGIRVCEEWNNFARFAEDMGDRPLGLTIDRIDVNGNYEKANCRWITQKEQCRNTRRNVVDLSTVKAIREAAANGDSLRIIATRYEISIEVARQIVNGKTWV